MNELNKIYQAILKSWNVLIKKDARLVVGLDGEEFPIIIDDMSMYLPLSEVLDSNIQDKVFFHPACENITSKETEVFKIIRRLSVMRLLTEFRKYPLIIMDIASKSKTKKTWRQDVLDMLEPIKGVKRTVRDELNELFGRMHVEVQDGVDNRFIHFKVTKGGGKLRSTGQNIFYKTKVTFPFYNEMVKRLARSEGQPDNQLVDVNGHSVSRGALNIAVHLFQAIIPMCATPDDFESIATNPTAARLTSYLTAYVEVAEQMNALQNTFRGDFDKEGIYPIDVAWAEQLELLPELYRQVPVMDYNSHNVHEEVSSSTNSGLGDMLSVTSSQPGQQTATTQQPVMTQQPQQVATTQQTPAGEFVTTVPPMQAGDQYQRTEIDYNTNRVYHYATNAHTGNMVMYHCTRFGNLMQRTETAPMQMQMMPGYQQGMYNMMPNGMIGQQMQPMMQYGMYQQTPTAGQSINNMTVNGGMNLTDGTF